MYIFRAFLHKDQNDPKLTLMHFLGDSDCRRLSVALKLRKYHANRNFLHKQPVRRCIIRA